MTTRYYQYRDCMEAIAAGKNVLREKTFTLNAERAREIFGATRAKNVYVAETMWLRHRPLYIELSRLLYEEKLIGDVFWATADFTSDIRLADLPARSRYRDLSLGAGSLLDVGMIALNDRPLCQGVNSSMIGGSPLVRSCSIHRQAGRAS